MSRGLAVIILVFMVCAFPLAHAEIEPDLKDLLASPVKMAILGYQRWISPAKGSQCPMVPSDSQYALLAIQRYGIFDGGLLAADRLHRCGHDLQFYPLIVTPSGLKFQDPVPTQAPH